MSATLPQAPPRRFEAAISSEGVQDAFFTAVLTIIGLVGFRDSFDGGGYLAVGIAGLALGLMIGYIANALKQPFLTVVAVTVLTFFLLGGAIALRAETALGVLPTAGGLRLLASIGVRGWKEFVTTLPPVDSQLLVLPYLLGLASGAVGMTLARRFRSPLVPVLAPLSLTVIVILLGTGQPAARLLQGIGFTGVALVWAALRSQRSRPLVRSGVGKRSRVITGVALIGVAAVLTTVAGSHLLGVSSHRRVILRSYVQPPFDINAYASPLVGFHKYTAAAKTLTNQTLLTVQGLPAGQPVRFAVLDDYDGSVWGATSGSLLSEAGSPQDVFQRVGSRIPSTTSGTSYLLHVRISPAYAQLSDLRSWLPATGETTSINFTGPDATAQAESLRYNLATASGVVTDGLHASDSYTLRAVIPSAATAQLGPYGRPTLDSSATAFVASWAAQWSGNAPSTWTQLVNVAAHLRKSGYYSDGGAGEEQYLPGHSISRLTTFLNSPQIVGNDEQYAAALSLMANELGMPARVVLGAQPETSGVVKGRDVHSWVEVHLGDGSWHAILPSAFMPPTSKHPNRLPPQSQSQKSASVVPPPNATHPPSTIDSAAADSSSLRSNANRKHPAGAVHVPKFLITAARWLLPPLIVLGAICGAIVAVKSRRRSRRRSHGAPPARIARGWTEIVDLARDLGTVVPRGRTRREEAALLSDHAVLDLANRADACVFGAASPSDQDATAYWAEVDTARLRLTGSLPRMQRWRAALSLRSLRPPSRTRESFRALSGTLPAAARAKP
jgi:hypothetical protein